MAEFDRVLGGGLVPGSVVLVGGEPGIGKSTLLLQALLDMEKRGVSALLISGEESAAQVKLRSVRLGGENSRLRLLTETQTEMLVSEQSKPAVRCGLGTDPLVWRLAPPRVGPQIRDATAQLLRVARTTALP